jgi:hypothetical protein
MQTLSLELTVQHDDDESPQWALQILVDDVSLIEIARRAEAPFAAAAGVPALAGNYGWTPARADKLLALHEATRSGWPLRTHWLQCTCGVAPCWPLLGTMRLEGGELVLGEFLQPHRDPQRHANGWRYDEMGPFRFSPQQVEAQVRHVEKQLRGLGDSPAPLRPFAQ